jgi:hypothetical protein
VIGFCLFIVLYFIAAAMYPGGSEVTRLAKGFSWMHNYWCDLLDKQAENGEPNTARTMAIIAMSVLCLSIASFWYFIPSLFPFKPIGQKIIRYSGILSMIILAFIQANSHDRVITISGLLGTIAIAGTLIGLYKNQSYLLFILGLSCVFLLILNNYIYYTKQWIYYLAIIQKISFFLFLLWFSLLSIQLFQRRRLTDQIWPPGTVSGA